MSIEEAASAIDRQITGNSGNGYANLRETASRAEPIFGNSDSYEDDVVAGGDDIETPEEKAARLEEERRSGKGKKRNNEEESEEPEDNEEESEEPEDDDSDEDDDDSDEDDDTKKLMSQKVVVRIDGGDPEEMTVREAIDGGIRVKTFQRRMNELDKVRTELSAHIDNFSNDRKKLDQQLEEAAELLSSLLPAEPNWDQLFAEDPAKAREIQKQYQAYQARVAEIRDKRSKTSKEYAEKEAKEFEEFARKEFPKFANYAKWRNDAEMRADLQSMRKTAQSIGFTQEEINTVVDSRMLTILLKASKFDRMMAAKPKVAKATKTPVNPGAGSGTVRSAHRGNVGAQRALVRTGSVEDAAAAFQSILNPRPPKGNRRG